MLPPLCGCGCRRASTVHKCAFVNTSGRPAPSAIVFFIETSGVFQKQVQKNKCRNVASRCSGPLQMLPLGRRLPSSLCHLLFSPTSRLLGAFYLSQSFKQAPKHTHTHLESVSLCFKLVPVINKSRGDTGIKIIDTFSIELIRLEIYQAVCVLSVVFVLYTVTPIWATVFVLMGCDTSEKGSQ